MIIEDSADIRDLVSHLLIEEGHHVQAFSNGIEALDYLSQAYKPGVILLDWRMPVMSGKKFLEIYKQTYTASDRAPIYIFSAEDDWRKFDELGCAGVVKKPINVDQLLDTVLRYAEVCS